MTRPVVLSIHPRWCDMILRGWKSVELRRSFAPSGRRTAFLHMTGSGVVGHVQIERVERCSTGLLWDRHGKASAVPGGEFDAYFAGQQTGCALLLGHARRWPVPATIADMRERGFCPPRSWRYANPDLAPVTWTPTREAFLEMIEGRRAMPIDVIRDDAEAALLDALPRLVARMPVHQDMIRAAAMAGAEIGRRARTRCAPLSPAVYSDISTAILAADCLPPLGATGRKRAAAQVMAAAFVLALHGAEGMMP